VGPWQTSICPSAHNPLGDGAPTMTDVTYVSLVPSSLRTKLRQILLAEDTGAIRWREHKRLFVSEFHFSGPAALARQTHSSVTEWLYRHG
jgi:hypothetical protein